jgi:hypothetical protein
VGLISIATIVVILALISWFAAIFVIRKVTKVEGGYTSEINNKLI